MDVVFASHKPDLSRAIARTAARRGLAAVRPRAVSVDGGTSAIEAVLPPRWRVLGLVIARVGDPRGLGALATRALELGRSVIALPVGMPDDEQAVLHAIARQHGFALAPSLDSLLDACAILHGCATLPRGPRIAVLAGSDGIAEEIGRLACSNGLELVGSPAVRKAGTGLPAHDVLALASSAGFPRIPRIAGTIIVRASVPAGLTETRTSRRGVVVQGGNRLVEVLGILQELGEAARLSSRRRTPARARRPRTGARATAKRDAARAVLEGPPRILSEPSSKRALAPYGIPFPAEVLCTSASRAESAARSLHAPLVAKIASPDLLDERNGKGVVRGIPNAQKARAAYHSLTRAALSHRADARVLGVLVSEAVSGIAEARIRIVRHPSMGLLLHLGASGALRAALPPEPLLLLPADRSDIERFARSAPISRLCEGGDRQGLVELIARAASFAHDLEPEVSEVLLDPIVVRPPGQGVVVTDARVTVG